MTRMNEKAEMSIISADLALERSISVREIRAAAATTESKNTVAWLQLTG